MTKACTSITKKGTPCKTAALNGEDVCLFHSQSKKGKSLRGSGLNKKKFIFGRIKIKKDSDVVGFLQAYMERIGNVGPEVTPQMTKSLADLVQAYIRLHELAMEKNAIDLSLAQGDGGAT